MNSQAFLWKIIFKNNQPVLEEEKNTLFWASLDETTRAIPGGAYTTLRTFDHWSTIHLNDHFERLKETCRLSGFSLEINHDLIRLGLKQILNTLSQCPDLRLRITIDLEKNKGQIFLAAEPLTTPSQSDYQTGVRVATKIMVRPNPKAKVSQFITSASDVRKEFGNLFNEIILVGEDGQMLEGLSSNFFAIKDGKIWTEEKDVLSDSKFEFVSSLFPPF